MSKDERQSASLQTPSDLRPKHDADQWTTKAQPAAEGTATDAVTLGFLLSRLFYWIFSADSLK